MKITNSRINKIIEKILFKTYDSHLSYEEKRDLIFKKVGILDKDLKRKYRDKFDKKIDKINRDIKHYHEISDSSSSNSSLSGISSSSDSNSSSSSGISRYQISSDNIIYPKKKMTIAEKKKFCRKHGLIYDRELDKVGKSYCRKDRRGRKKKKIKEEDSVVKEEDSVVKEEDSVVKVEDCNIKEDGSDINCGLDKVCNLDNKKCEKLEDNMEIHNINGANVIGDELIVKKIKELIKERNEFNMNRENDYDIKKCFGLLVEDSDSE